MSTLNVLYKIAADISGLRTDANRAIATMDKMDSSITKIQSKILGAFSVTAVIAFGNELLDTADQIVKVADRTGLLTEQVQKLDYIAGQSGNSLDELTQATSKLQVNLGSNNEGTIGALGKLGINLAQIKQADPYQQLELIATKIAAIPDPAQRAAAAVEIFGRAGATILPTLISNFKELGEQAPVMSDATVQGLDRAGDAIARATALLKTAAAEGIGSFFRAWDKAFSPEEAEYGAKFFRVFHANVDDEIRNLKILGQVISDLPKLPDINAPAGFGAVNTTGMVVSNAEQALKAYNEQLAVTEKNQKLAATAARDHDVALEKLGKTAVKAFSDYHEMLEKVDFQMGILVRQRLNEFGEAARKTMADATDGTLNWITAVSGAIPVVDGLSKAWAHVGEQVDITIVPFKEKLDTFFMTPAGVATGFVNDAFHSLSLKVQDSMSGMLSGVGGMFGQFLQAVLPAFAGALMGGLADLAMKGLSWLGSKIWGGIKSLFGGGSGGRDMVEDFASSQGGFDALHAMLQSRLGDSEAERLWVQLTQMVGRGDKGQAQSAIDAIMAAFGGSSSPGNGIWNTTGLTLDGTDVAAGNSRGLTVQVPVTVEMDGQVVGRSVDDYQLNQYKNQVRVSFA